MPSHNISSILTSPMKGCNTSQLHQGFQMMAGNNIEIAIHSYSRNHIRP